ncbi:MAG: site-specific integrase, partial [Nitriliruptoraceae bacterium]
SQPTRSRPKPPSVYETRGASDTELRHLRPSTVQSWVRSRQAVVAPSYCRLLLTNLSSILSAAVEDSLIARNPCASPSVRAPKSERPRVIPWTIEREQNLIDAHPASYRGAPALGAGCGLRQGEVFGLALGDVDFLRRTVHVRQQVRPVGKHLVFAPPKGGRERDVPLPETVSFALAKQLERQEPVEVALPWRDVDGKPHTAELIFTNRDGGPLTRSWYQHNAWKPALNAAGISPETRRNGFHALRHHYASVLLDSGVSIRAVAEYLGHHDPGFTLRTYAHLMPASDDRARSAIDAAHSAADAYSAADYSRTGLKAET